jgi:LmbE family N-acetylglucosaminyl deacetylase
MTRGPILVVAPHPDDEVLGPGGTIARHADEGREVYVVIVTHADPSIFPDYSLEEGRGEAVRADEILGVRKTLFLEGFPAALLDTLPQSSINAAIQDVVDQVEPEVLLVPFPGDLHVDHRKVAEAAMVAARPGRTHLVREVWAYETVSETHWSWGLGPPFQANAYVDISRFLETKLEAAAEFRSQLRSFPHERSVEALRALATARGTAVSAFAAEAFHLLRVIDRL